MKQIRFPSKLVTENDKGRWSIKQEHLYSIFRSNDVYLGGERTYSFEEDLRRLCKSYGLSFRNQINQYQYQQLDIRNEENAVFIGDKFLKRNYHQYGLWKKMRSGRSCLMSKI